MTKLLLALALVTGLGDKDFRARERAQRALTELNNDRDLRNVLRPFLKHPDPEVARRVGAVMADYDDVWAGLAAAPPIWKFERSAYTTLYDLANSFSYLVHEVMGPCGCEDDGARYDRAAQASFIYARFLLDSGLTRQEVRRLIDKALAPTPVPTPREVKSK